MGVQSGRRSHFLPQFVLVSTLLVAAAAPARVQEAVDSRARAQALVSDIAARTRAPAVQAAVVRDGRVVFSHAVGYADLELQVRASTATRFRIGSVSKALTAAATSRLVDRGRLDLDAPIVKYLPEFPDKGQPITARQLLTHLGGIRHYAGDEFTSAVRYATVLDSLKVFAGDPLVAQPGTKPVYSTYGYVLLSAVLERASGRPFLDLMDEEVFRPLDMQRTVPDMPERIIADRARPYARNRDNVIENAPFVDNSNKWAGGGFLSTAEDLARFGAKAFSAEYLQPATAQLMLTPARTADGTATTFGFGVRLQMENGRLLYAHHGGSSLGGRGFLYIDPNRQLAAAFTANMFCTIDENDARALAALFQ